MIYSMRPIVLTGAVICFIANSANAQLDLSKWQVGANAGIMIYQGDLTPSQFGSYRTMKPAIGIFVSRILTPSFILRTNLALGRLKGDDAKYSTPDWRQQRNFNFTSRVTEISELLVWNMYGNNSNEIGNRFSPYLFGGVGINFTKINRDYSNLNIDYFSDKAGIMEGLAADVAHTLPKKMVILPVGAGVEFYVSPKIALTAETMFRYTFTDYLDGFSRAANPEKKDFYHSHTVGVVYKFGSKNAVGCPVFKN